MRKCHHHARWADRHGSSVSHVQDFRTGYFTLASPKALFVAQLAGSFMGVLFAPAIYKFYTVSFPIGIPGTQYSVPFAKVYRLMAVVSANGAQQPHANFEEPFCCRSVKHHHSAVAAWSCCTCCSAVLHTGKSSARAIPTRIVRLTTQASTTCRTTAWLSGVASSAPRWR